MDIYHICTYFLHQQYTGEPIHNINISLTNLIQEGQEQISLFNNIAQREQEMKLTKVIDEIRTKFEQGYGSFCLSRTYGSKNRIHQII